jgi:fibronectin-binding autotransporter adhesin
VPGFSGSTGGFLAGYDRPVVPNLTLGVAGGYLHSDVSEHAASSSGTEQSVRLSVYGGYHYGQSLFSGTVGYAHDWFDSHRGIAGIGTASENHAGNEASVAGQWSTPIALRGLADGTATLTPKAGISYIYLSEDSFSESGAGGFDLSNSGHGTNSLQPYVGAALAQKFVTGGGTAITPEVRMSYAHDMFDSRNLTVNTASGSAFVVQGVKPSRDQLSAGLGVVMQATETLSAYADYDAILPTGNTTEQTLQAGLRIRF